MKVIVIIHSNCKKGVALCKMASMKKVVKYRWRPRNGCDGRSVTKILITTIQVSLCCLIPASLGIGTKFTWIVVIKILVTDLPSQPFLGHHLCFTTFFIIAILHRAAPFFTAWLFLSGYHIFYNLSCFFSVARRRKHASRGGDITFIACLVFKYCHI